MILKRKYENVDDIIDGLLDLDIACESRGVQAELLLLGGSALMMLLSSAQVKHRATRDLDMNILSSNSMKDTREIFMNLGIDLVEGISLLPPTEDFRGEKYEIEAGFSSIKVFVPGVELFVITKMFSKRQKDLTDLESSGILDLCNIKTLLELATEYKDYYIYFDDPELNYHSIYNLLVKKLQIEDDFI